MLTVYFQLSALITGGDGKVDSMIIRKVLEINRNQAYKW